MSHATREKTKLIARVRRIGGQVEAVERALEAELGCGEILQLLASVRGAMNGLMAEVMEDHLREHVLLAPNAQMRSEGAEELVAVMRTYLK